MSETFLPCVLCLYLTCTGGKVLISSMVMRENQFSFFSFFFFLFNFNLFILANSRNGYQDAQITDPDPDDSGMESYLRGDDPRIIFMRLQ